MSKQPPSKAKAAVKEKGFLETIKDKIGSGMGYIDSVSKARPAIMTTGGGFQQPSPAMYKATQPKPKPAKKP
jgi:hypothetical protein